MEGGGGSHGVVMSGAPNEECLRKRLEFSVVLFSHNILVLLKDTM